MAWRWQHRLTDKNWVVESIFKVCSGLREEKQSQAADRWKFSVDLEFLCATRNIEATVRVTAVRSLSCSKQPHYMCLSVSESVNTLHLCMSIFNHVCVRDMWRGCRGDQGFLPCSSFPLLIQQPCLAAIWLRLSVSVCMCVRAWVSIWKRCALYTFCQSIYFSQAAKTEDLDNNLFHMW